LAPKRGRWFHGDVRSDSAYRVDRARVAVSTVVSAVLVGMSCSSESSDRPEAAERTSTSGLSQRCENETTIDEDGPHGPEVRGFASDASLYGLVFLHGHAPVGVGDEVKIVWRMTGSGELKIRVADPAGAPRTLTFGPERHFGSTYDRPGDEWGSGFLFDVPGCWHITLERTVGSGEVWIDVRA